MYKVEGEKLLIYKGRGIAMHIKKMIASLGAAALVCLNFSVVSYADTVTAASLTNDSVSPMYEIADNCRAVLEIQSGTAQCTSIADSSVAPFHISRLRDCVFGESI